MNLRVLASLKNDVPKPGAGKRDKRIVIASCGFTTRDTMHSEKHVKKHHMPSKHGAGTNSCHEEVARGNMITSATRVD